MVFFGLEVEDIFLVNCLQLVKDWLSLGNRLIKQNLCWYAENSFHRSIASTSDYKPKFKSLREACQLTKITFTNNVLFQFIIQSRNITQEYYHYYLTSSNLRIHVSWRHRQKIPYFFVNKSYNLLFSVNISSDFSRQLA